MSGRRGLIRRIRSEDFESLGIAGHVEPFSAAESMAPPFQMIAARVLAIEQISRPFLIRTFRTGADNMSFPATGKLGFFPFHAAAWARNQKHFNDNPIDEIPMALCAALFALPSWFSHQTLATCKHNPPYQI